MSAFYEKMQHMFNVVNINYGVYLLTFIVDVSRIMRKNNPIDL